MKFQKGFLMDEQHYEGSFWTSPELLQSKHNSDCNQSVFFIKKNSIFLILNKKQNISNQNSTVIGPIASLLARN